MLCTDDDKVHIRYRFFAVCQPPSGNAEGLFDDLNRAFVRMDIADSDWKNRLGCEGTNVEGSTQEGTNVEGSTQYSSNMQLLRRGGRPQCPAWGYGGALKTSPIGAWGRATEAFELLIALYIPQEM